MGILHSLRRIRRCENEVAAQVVLEHLIKEEVDAALKAQAEPVANFQCSDGLCGPLIKEDK